MIYTNMDPSNIGLFLQKSIIIKDEETMLDLLKKNQGSQELYFTIR